MTGHWSLRISWSRRRLSLRRIFFIVGTTHCCMSTTVVVVRFGRVHWPDRLRGDHECWVGPSSVYVSNQGWRGDWFVLLRDDKVNYHNWFLKLDIFSTDSSIHCSSSLGLVSEMQQCAQFVFNIRGPWHVGYLAIQRKRFLDGIFASVFK